MTDYDDDKASILTDLPRYRASDLAERPVSPSPSYRTLPVERASQTRGTDGPRKDRLRILRGLKRTDPKANLTESFEVAFARGNDEMIVSILSDPEQSRLISAKSLEKALHKSVREKNPYCYLLLNAGPPLTGVFPEPQPNQDKRGDTIVHTALRFWEDDIGSMVCLRALNTLSPIFWDRPGVDGLWPLEIAIEQGNEYMVLELLKSGCRVFRGGPGRLSMLHDAAKLGSVPIARALLRHGPGINHWASSWCPQTPLMWALDHGQLGVARFFVEQGARVDEETFALAAALGDVALVQAMRDQLQYTRKS